jgi:hypothetical protein
VALRKAALIVLLALVLGASAWAADATAVDVAGTAKRAPTGRISGKSVVKDRGLWLPFANVIVLGTRLGVMSDVTGSFVLSGVPIGPQRLACQAIGYERDTMDVMVRQGATTYVTIMVPALPGTLEPERPVERDTSWLEQRPDQRSRVGTRCRVHPSIELALDTVRIHHGIVGIGLLPTELDSFPNAARAVDGGCVVGYQTHAEIAYCPQCRAAYARWRERNQPKR